ncbi:hypothetical protein DHX103_00385 [Planococcus sp. X10-3]|uniref:hypothetical protein n=1 Tax=Planococcus sp. X10-3 TaxID=3061240 RepID=UPI003BB1B8E2
MNKTVKIASLLMVLVLVIIFALTYLVISLLEGDEVFETTTEEIETFTRLHLTDPTALEDYFIQLEDETETRFAIQDHKIAEDRSFSESTYTKDESAFDNQREVYVTITYQTTGTDKSVYTLCKTCSYEATAIYEYEDGNYLLDAVKFEQNWLFETLAETLAPEYVEMGTLPDSPYYYHIVSDHERTLSFNELSATGYWDKDTDNFMLTVPLYSDPVPLHNGIIFGDLFDYDTRSSTSGFLRINDDGSVSLYETPSVTPSEDTGNPDVALVKTFLPK